MPHFEIKVKIVREITRVVEADSANEAKYQQNDEAQEEQLALSGRMHLKHWTDGETTETEKTVKKIGAPPESLSRPLKPSRNPIGSTRHIPTLAQERWPRMSHRPRLRMVMDVPKDYSDYDLEVIERAAIESAGDTDEFIMSAAHDAALAILIKKGIFIATDDVYERLKSLPRYLHDRLPMQPVVPRNEKYMEEMAEHRDTVPAFENEIRSLESQIVYYRNRIIESEAETNEVASKLLEMPLSDLRLAIKRNRIVFRDKKLRAELAGALQPAQPDLESSDG